MQHSRANSTWDYFEPRLNYIHVVHCYRPFHAHGIPNSNLLLVVINKIDSAMDSFKFEGTMTTEAQVMEVKKTYNVSFPCHKLYMNELPRRRLTECFVSWTVSSWIERECPFHVFNSINSFMTTFSIFQSPHRPNIPTRKQLHTADQQIGRLRQLRSCYCQCSSILLDLCRHIWKSIYTVHVSRWRQDSRRKSLIQLFPVLQCPFLRPPIILKCFLYERNVMNFWILRNGWIRETKKIRIIILANFLMSIVVCLFSLKNWMLFYVIFDRLEWSDILWEIKTHINFWIWNYYQFFIIPSYQR